MPALWHPASINFFCIPAGDRTTLIKYYVQKSGCKASLVPELWFPGGFGFALPFHSPFKPFFDQT